MKRSNIAGLVLIALTGCAVSPSEPELPTGKSKVTVNSSSVVAQAMSDYYRAEADKKARAMPPRKYTKLTINQIVERYMPSDFRVFASEGVDLEIVVEYETALPWTEALGKPLTDAGIDMSANLDTKTMFLRLGITTIEQVLAQRVPAEYTVYANESLRLDTVVKVDRTKPWAEALGKALAAAGISMTTNVDKKVIVLKPKERSRLIRFKDTDEVAAAAASSVERQNVEISAPRIISNQPSN